MRRLLKRRGCFSCDIPMAGNIVFPIVSFRAGVHFSLNCLTVKYVIVKIPTSMMTVAMAAPA